MKKKTTFYIMVRSEKETYFAFCFNHDPMKKKVKDIYLIKNTSYFIYTYSSLLILLTATW